MVGPSTPAILSHDTRSNDFLLSFPPDDRDISKLGKMAPPPQSDVM